MKVRALVSETSPQWPRLWVAVAFGIFAMLCAYVLTRTRPPFFDEQLHLARALALPEAESWRDWLLANETSATGPLFALMHNALALGHGALPVPWFRLPNLVFLAAVIALLAAILRRSGQTEPWACACTALAMPTSWVLSGLSLTEMPAQCGVAIACWAALELGDADRPDWRLLLALAFGVAVATTGRQTYAAVLPSLLLLAARNRRVTLVAGVALVVGLVPLAGLAIVWGGFLPPKLSYMGSGGFSYKHLFEAVSYVGVITAVLAPGYFMVRWRIVLSVAVAAAGLNLLLPMVHFTTLTSVQQLVGYPTLMRGLEAGASVLFVAAGAGFVTATGLKSWGSRDRWFLSWATGVLGLCVACGAVTAIFSSRYVGMALVFLVPLLAPWMQFNGWAILRLLTGILIGAASLYSYFRLG